jgi:TatD DNase family protein
MLDAHCHIDLYHDPHQAALEAERHRIYTLAVTRLPSHFLEARSHLSGFRYVRPALGFHPLLVAENFSEISKLKSLIPLTTYIGEVGLDFCTARGVEKERQIEIFEYILSLIRNQDKILTIHSRRAEAQVLKLLLRYDCRKSIFHWYSGSLSTLREIVEHDFYISVNSQMLRTKTGRQIVKAVPPERILTETDGPFIKIDGRTIQPTDVKLAESALAEVWAMEHQQVSQLIIENFKRLLSKDAYAAASTSLSSTDVY